MPKYLIPKPKSITEREGVFCQQKKNTLFYSKEVYKIALMLKDDWKGDLTLEQVNSSGAFLFIGDEFHPKDADTIEHPEGYSLEITKKFVAVSATNYRGLYYGYTTLTQLMERHNPLPEVSVFDYPDLFVRGVHFDFKGSLPTVDYIKDFIKKMGRCKINTLLFEYEDKFPFRSYPEISSPDAFTSQELKEILDTAKDCAMDVIPLLQCLGHAEYILRHETFAALAENGERFMLCPKNPDSFTLFKTLAEEILEYHPDSKIFHIGGDEARQLGECPDCKAFMESGGKKGLFIEHIKKVTEYIVSKGKKPMMWDDMFYQEDAFEKIEELPKETVMTVWEYFATSSKTPAAPWKHARYISKEWIYKDPGKIRFNRFGLPGGDGFFGCWLEDLPESEQETLKKYKYEDNYPYMGKAFPWISKLAEYNVDIIGASGVKGHTYNTLFSDFGERFYNTATWAGEALRLGIRGVISTAWGRFSTPAPSTDFWEAAIYNYIASGESYWNAGCTKEEFDGKFSVAYLGAESDVVKAMDYMVQGLVTGNVNYIKSALHILKEEMGKIIKNRQYAEVLISCAEFMKLELEFDGLLAMASPALYYVHEKDVLRKQYNARFTESISKYEQQVIKWQEDAMQLYGGMMPYELAKELVMTKTSGILFVINSIAEKLK